jgi:uncharacterized membrane protein YeaQ/YmgE (transglycosylase-associated protein family)
MTENNRKPMKWITINLILIVAALVTVLTFNLLGRVFDLPPTLIQVIVPAVIGSLAAFLVVRSLSGNKS